MVKIKQNINACIPNFYPKWQSLHINCVFVCFTLAAYFLQVILHTWPGACNGIT